MAEKQKGPKEIQYLQSFQQNKGEEQPQNIPHQEFKGEKTHCQLEVQD
jgi:hypothetical protein